MGNKSRRGTREDGEQKLDRDKRRWGPKDEGGQEEIVTKDGGERRG